MFDFYHYSGKSIPEYFVMMLFRKSFVAGLGNLSCLEPCNRACFLSKKPCPVTLSKFFQKNESLLTACRQGFNFVGKNPVYPVFRQGLKREKGPSRHKPCLPVFRQGFRQGLAQHHKISICQLD
jgi:hypothetical protein